jgi:hypothetical protein
MSLEASAREANFRDSIKKFFVDNIETTEGVPVTFDKALSSPNIQGKEVERWVSIVIGPIGFDTLSDAIVEVYCCSRRDNEGYKLSQLRDKVLGYLIDYNMIDGKSRIDFYQSSYSGAWTLIGKILVWDILQSGDIIAPDETKFKTLTLLLKVPMNV